MADSQSGGIGPSQSWLSRILFGGVSEDLPKVDQPGSWYPEPLVAGGKDLAKEVYSFNQKYPRAKKWVKSVTLGPTKGTMQEMIDSGLSPDKFKNTSLLGMYYDPRGTGDASIGISPRFAVPSDDRSITLGHEMGHALGLDSDSLAELFGLNWMSQYRKKKLSADDQSGVDTLMGSDMIPETR